MGTLMAIFRWTFISIISLGFIFSFPFEANATRREGTRTIEELHLKLKVPAKFGDVIILANRVLRVGVGEGGLALADPKTMFLVSTIAAKKTIVKKYVSKPKLFVVEAKTKVTIILRKDNERYEAVGKVVKVTKKSGRKDVVSNKKGVDVEADVAKRPEDAQLIVSAVSRFTSGVLHCAENAFRFKQKTDDPKFTRCVCPITESWRLPKIKAPLRVSVYLERNRTGISFTATARGRVSECRVWSGRTPPEGEPPLLSK